MDKELIQIDIKELGLYKKKNVRQYFIKSTDLGQKGNYIDITTKEGVIDVMVDENTYIMIGNYGDIYPIAKDIFDIRYRVVRIEGVNSTVRDFISNYSISEEQVNGCELRNNIFVYAKEIDSFFCVYEKNTHSILNGRPGDYYVVAKEDPTNAYIIQKDIMEKTYESII